MVSANIHTTAIRIDKALYEKLTELASKEERSVNQQMVLFIKQGLERSASSTISQRVQSDIAETAETA